MLGGGSRHQLPHATCGMGEVHGWRTVIRRRVAQGAGDAGHERGVLARARMYQRGWKAALRVLSHDGDVVERGEKAEVAEWL